MEKYWLGIKLENVASSTFTTLNHTMVYLKSKTKFQLRHKAISIKLMLKLVTKNKTNAQQTKPSACS